MTNTISPLDGSVYCSTQNHTEKDIKDTLELAKKTFPIWSNLSVKERSNYVTAF
ncbi:MAG: aldehyde dehydrogenase family protein [Flavobacteriaceae bacterium]|nr:aldehyde dehydrogenase family protein [Flavobacteriaceae bacterium]